MEHIEYIPAKNIVTRTKNSGWFGCEYNMNIYRGCPHGCIYCDSRSACYGTVDFDTVKVKEDALRLINHDLSRKIKPGVVSTGAMSDPYNPLEKELCLTRHALELISAHGFGVSIATKSVLVTRDTDVLREIREHSPVLIKFTITCADDALSQKVEPYAPTSGERFKALEIMAQGGFFAGILLMPVLPFIQDNADNILSIVERAAQCGARFIYPAFGMTMRDNQRDYFLENAEKLFPGIAAKYVSRYGGNYNCPSPKAKELWQLFKNSCDKHGILYNMKDIISGYKTGYSDSQLSWF